MLKTFGKGDGLVTPQTLMLFSFLCQINSSISAVIKKTIYEEGDPKKNHFDQNYENWLFYDFPVPDNEFCNTVPITP